jgi:hypothetical protein
MGMTRTTIALLFLLAFAMLGCGTIDGTDPYALWDTYEHPLDAYHFHYPAPPWKRADDSTDTAFAMVVAPDDSPDAGEPGARYRLESAIVPGVETADASSDERSRLEARGYATSTPREWTNAAGDPGLVIEGRDRDASVVEILIATSYGVAALRLFSREDLDDPDVDLVLESLEPRAAGGD